jgi:hypothetical protein
VVPLPSVRIAGYSLDNVIAHGPSFSVDSCFASLASGPGRRKISRTTQMHYSTFLQAKIAAILERHSHISRAGNEGTDMKLASALSYPARIIGCGVGKGVHVPIAGPKLKSAAGQAMNLKSASSRDGKPEVGRPTVPTRTSCR